MKPISLSSSSPSFPTSKMGKVSKENSMLKLVRAGGIVELYKHPIKAAQIMERYPRHCVTRPDVFRYPYIVVKPESVLKPGQIFYIVPYHTIYRLLKSKGYGFNHRYTTRDHNESDKKQTLGNIHPMESIDTSFFHQIVPLENAKNNKQSNRQVTKLSVTEKRDFKNGDCDCDEPLAANGCFLTHKEGGELKGNCKDTADDCLKPCLRKNQTNNRTRAHQGPRVRFMLPDQGDEKWETDFSEF